MHYKRAFELIVLGLSAVSVAEASFINARLVRNGKAIERRQDGGDGSDSKAATTSTSAAAVVETSTSTTTTSTPPTPTSTSTSTSSTSTPPNANPTSTSSSTTASSTPPPSQTSSKSSDPSTSSPATTAPATQSETQEPSVQTQTHIVTVTDQGGKLVTSTSISLTTSTPGLANGSNNQASSGMSTQTRNTVIGVVVGVGGAIVLGGLAFVAWRIWGRKKQQDENVGLMDYGSVGTAEKPDTVGSVGGRTPFQSTLESYHAPTPHSVNTASNF